MRFASALSTKTETNKAIEDVCRSAASQLGGPADLAVVFVTRDHRTSEDTLAARIASAVDTSCLIGCTAESVVGTGVEVEQQPAISLWLASLPNVSVIPMHLQFQQTSDGGTVVGWPDDLLQEWPAGASLMILGEPFSFPADWLLEKINEDHPGVPVIGGMASGAAEPGENSLLLGRQDISEGAVALLIHGAVKLRTIVSQGCRPIGQHFVITAAEQNVIQQLGGRPAIERLQEVFAQLPTREQLLVQQGLHVGRVVSEYQDRFEQGDFLVRNVIGVDQESGAIVVGDYMRPGQTVQFHVRDRQTADDELRQLLAAVSNGPGGALLFTCNGRGTRLFQEPHHDASCVSHALGEIPLAGFFAQGELGPVGGKNFMHGFTASLALFEPA